MKTLFTIDTLEKLLQIIFICITAAAMLFLLESCEAAYLNHDNQVESKVDIKIDSQEYIHLNALNLAGEDDMNIVFVPEGYTADQMGAFMDEVNVAWGIIRQTKPYSHSLDRINVYYSTELASATDSLGSGHTTFGIDAPKPNHAGCGISCDSIKNVTKKLPFAIEKTILVVMVNVGGDTQIGFTIMSKPEPEMYLPETVVIRSLFCRDPAAFTHELGHAIGLLADEYYYDDESMVFGEEESLDLLSWQNDGVFLNISTCSDEAFVPWSQFIFDEAFADEEIGIFEGADSYPHGVYRSTYNSVMRFHFQSDFYNAYDRYLICRRIEFIHSGREISYDEWRGIDLAYPQSPINWHGLTGGITRTDSSIGNDYCIIGPDVFFFN